MIAALLLGRGRMGTLVETLAAQHGVEVRAVLSRESAEQRLASKDFGAVDVAIDFTIADAVPRHLPRLADLGINVVIGTTGWSAIEDEMRAIVAAHGIGVFAAPNFSIGMNLFQAVIEDAARWFVGHPSFSPWIYEQHHSAKKDAPSGTALQLRRGLERAGYTSVDVAATRAGFVPGTHQVGFDALAESITFTHTVRDRAVFAHGALEAAKWLVGRRGWFTMRDLVEPASPPTSRML